jgi:hypothetical protein
LGVGFTVTSAISVTPNGRKTIEISGKSFFKNDIMVSPIRGGILVTNHFILSAKSPLRAAFYSKWLVEKQKCRP